MSVRCVFTRYATYLIDVVVLSLLRQVTSGPGCHCAVVVECYVVVIAVIVVVFCVHVFSSFLPLLLLCKCFHC